MGDEKRPKKARIELRGSTAPAFARLVAAAMVDEGDTKTAMLTQTLSSSRLLDVLPRPVLEHMAQYLDSVIDRKPLFVALGRKGPLGSDPAKVVSKWVEAFRWPTCVVDHESRHDLRNDLNALAKWLPTRPQQTAALRTLVLRDVLDLLEKRPGQHEVRDLFAPLKPHIRSLVLQHSVYAATTPDALSPSLFCGAALRSIRVQQTGESFWTLQTFTKWLRTKAPLIMALERFEWMQLAPDLLSWTLDIRPLLELWTSSPVSRRPTHLGFALVKRVSRKEIDAICSSLPQLKSLRLQMLRMKDGPSCLDALAKLEQLTDLQLPGIRPEPDLSFDELALSTRVANFRQLRQLFVTEPDSRFQSTVDVMDTLAPLVHMRYFRGFATWLPLDPKSWPTIRGLSIVEGARDAFDEAQAKRLVRFVKDHHDTLRWVDMIDVVTTGPAVQLLTECKSCPWRHVDMRAFGEEDKRDTEFPITLTTALMRLSDFKWPVDWVERFFPLSGDNHAPTRGNLRALVFSGPSLSLSIDQMKRLADAARHLETVDLSVDVLDIGNDTNISEWCNHLATWPRKFPRLRSMVVDVGRHPRVPTSAFSAPIGPGPTDLPHVRFSFPTASVRMVCPAGDPAFHVPWRPYYYMSTWVEPADDEKED
jgi:hypothetical protein